MNPYVHPLRKLDIQGVIKEFMRELDMAASAAVRMLKS
jgi:hypothetical protein